MSEHINSIIERINRLQQELEAAVGDRSEKFRYSIENRRIKFKAEALRWQRQFKQKPWQYFRNTLLLDVVTAPIIYSLIVPFVLLDIWVNLYQAICFPAYGMQKVRRSDYVVFDRQHLAYLNLIQKANCLYCSYGNGLLAFTREVAARTEAYWCPIKHARKTADMHGWYDEFSDYGDAENYHADLKRNMDRVRGEKRDTDKDADSYSG